MTQAEISSKNTIRLKNIQESLTNLSAMSSVSGSQFRTLVRFIGLSFRIRLTLKHDKRKDPPFQGTGQRVGGPNTKNEGGKAESCEL